MTPEQQHAIEKALEAYPFWPFNTQRFVRLGTRIIGWLLDRWPPLGAPRKRPHVF